MLDTLSNTYKHCKYIQMLSEDTDDDCIKIQPLHF